MAEGSISAHDLTAMTVEDSLSIERVSGEWSNAGDGSISKAMVVDKLEERLDVDLKVTVLINNPSLPASARHYLPDQRAVGRSHVAAKKIRL